MDGILDIFQSISNTKVSNLKNFINAINEHQTFRLNEISTNNAAIQHITELISKPETRFKGLLMLPSFINQTSLDILEQKGNIWANSCLKVCIQKNEDHAIPYAYDVLAMLIEKSVNIPELTKVFASSLTAKICETLNHCQSNSHSSALNCLENILRLYPAQCGGVTRAIIEKFLFKFIDSDEISLIRSSGKCYQLFQQIRSNRTQPGNQKSSWQNYQIQLLGSLHRLLNLMYANCPEMYQEYTEEQELNLPPLELSDEPVERAAQLTKRFKGIATYLMIAIREPYPLSKTFSPNQILILITRGLAVNSESVRKNPISDNIAIGALLPEIHVLLHNILDSLILVLKTNMALYYQNVLEVILDTLKWTSTGKSCGFAKPYKSLKIAAYNTLTLWCKTMKYGSCVETYFENLIKFIHDDITPFQTEITLQVLSGAKKHMSKKARRQLHKAQNEKSHLAQTHSKSSDIQNIKTVYSDHDNQLLCGTALQSLNEILIYASTFLKPVMIKQTQIKVIEIAMPLKEMFLTSTSTNSILLYANSICRQRLYELLCTIVMARHDLCPPPTQLIIEILVQSQNLDPSSLVRDSCAKSLKTLEKILHPQKDSLYLPSSMYNNDVLNILDHNQQAAESDAARDETSETEDILVNSSDRQNDLLKNTKLTIVEPNHNGNNLEDINLKEQENQPNKLVGTEISKVNGEKICTEDSIAISDEDDDGSENADDGEDSEIEEIKIDDDSDIEEIKIDKKNRQGAKKSNKRKILEEPTTIDLNEDDDAESVTKKVCVNKAGTNQNDDNIEENNAISSEEVESVADKQIDDDTLLNKIVSTFVDELNN